MTVGAFVVIFDAQRRVLLCHRRDFDAWNLPGGGAEAGESPWDAAIRETREEVGLDVELVRLTGIYWKPRKGELVFNFEARAVGGAPATIDEADAVGYFVLDAMPSNTAPLQIERIHDAFAGGPPVIRTQTGAGIRDLFPAMAGRR